MKKQLLACSFLLLSGQALLGQEVHFGIKAGLNYASVQEFRFRYSDNNLRTEFPAYRYGVHAGVYAEIVLPFPLSFQPEFSYSRKGFRFEPGRAEADVLLSYFELPLLIK
ncbi:MAG TPA: outer membrane beta-barrel protein, partial [Anseongella sp.]|nr:outer membrane beta-barrel protein [Anseongella sp.]